MLSQVALGAYLWCCSSTLGPIRGPVSSPGHEGALAKLCPGTLCIVPGDVQQTTQLPVAPRLGCGLGGDGCTGNTLSLRTFGFSLLSFCLFSFLCTIKSKGK